MSNKEKIECLKKYKEVLIYAIGYEPQKVKEQEEPQKVLVLKRKWNRKESSLKNTILDD